MPLPLLACLASGKCFAQKVPVAFFLASCLITPLLCVEVGLQAATTTILGTIAEGSVTDTRPIDGVFDATNSSLVVAEAGTSRDTNRAVFEFDVSSLADYVPIEQATLHLYVSTVLNPYAFELEYYGYAGNGRLDVADADAGNLIDVQPGTIGAVTVDVTSHLQGLLAAGEDVAGIMVRNTAEGSLEINGQAFFRKSDFGVESLRPRLQIQPIPEPSTLAMLAAVMAGLLARVRRKQASR